MNADILSYNDSQAIEDQKICHLLSYLINKYLPEADGKIWHAHPVWFIDKNPIVGYSKQKQGIRLMFWSGADFDEALLHILPGKFRDASVFYVAASQIQEADLARWLEKSRNIQWDYKNIVKRKGVLERLK